MTPVAMARKFGKKSAITRLIYKINATMQFITPFNGTMKHQKTAKIRTPCQRQASERYLLYKTSQRRFCLKLRCHGNGNWSRQNLSGVIQQNVPKTPAIRKDLRDICYISRVIADFVPNFVAMATEVIRRKFK